MPRRPLKATSVADAIRRQIAEGALTPGQWLGSRKDLALQHNVAEGTVGLAIDLLAESEDVEIVAGRGARIRTASRPRRVLETRSANRYRRPSPGGETSPFAKDAQREGAAPTWSWETGRYRADDSVAERLGIEAGAFVMRTSYIFRAGGEPIQLSTSWEPYDLVGGTEVEEPEGQGRVVGVIARMDSISVRVDRVAELVTCRPPTDDERRLLAIPEEVWVQLIRRTHWAGDRAVEIADIVIPADRYILEYVIHVP